MVFLRLLLSTPLIIVVDHKPLVGLLNEKSLDDVANTRLFRLKEKTMPWKSRSYINPAKQNLFADATSRNTCSMEEKGSIGVNGRSGDDIDSEQNNGSTTTKVAIPYNGGE